MSLKAHMICHTHWDREWYLTREEFRTKLVRLIDGLLELIDDVPEYVSFMLDGQTIAIEDYLEIKPYNREKLFDALKKGKIISGPWYVLPDELLISGESHIRNYQKGTQVVKESGKKMETAYLPDSFGHPAQMPQIVKGLGMNAMVFWRGVSNEVKLTEFYWESPYADSKILCVHMPHGYGNCGNLSSNMQETVPRVRELLDSLGAKSSTEVVLLMNGSDHIIGQNDICEVVKALNKQLPNCQIKLSTMEGYLDNLREEIDKQFRKRRAKGSDPFALPTYRGELRSGERSMLLGGTISTRMYLKQKNEVVQNKAERYLEPLLSLEKLAGKRYDSRGCLDYIWKKILENHPHDSICGCSIDEVHREMMSRFACVEQLEDMLIHDTVIRNEESVSGQEGRKAALFLFEPTTAGRPSYAEIEIYLDDMLIQYVDFTKSLIVDREDQICHLDLPAGIRITDETGREIPHVILEAEKDYSTLYQDHTMPEIYKANKIRAGVLLPGFTFGCHRLLVEVADLASDWKKKSQESVIENEFYSLHPGRNGIILLDKRTGKELDGFANLIDKGDAGDEYTYSWPFKDREYKVDFSALKAEKEVQKGICQSLLLSGVMKLPKAVSEDRSTRTEVLTECPFSMKITLIRGINRIDCHLEFENHAKDHRLQVQFPSGIRTQNSESYHIFNMNNRPIEAEIPEEWMEYPQSTHPAQGYIGLSDGLEAMSVGTIGLPEYEAVQTHRGTAVNVTLLRCVGWLSRTDLLTRKGNGGWTIETKEAQCLGKHEFDFCVTYHSDQTMEAFRTIEKFRYPCFVQSMKKKAHSSLVKSGNGKFLNVLPPGIQMSALKPAEDQDGVILRLYSIESQKKTIELCMPDSVSRIFLTNLAEMKEKELEIKEGKITFEMHPNQIVTLYMETIS